MKKAVLFITCLGTLFLCLPLKAIDGSPHLSFDTVEQEIEIINSASGELLNSGMDSDAAYLAINMIADEDAAILEKLDPNYRMAPNAEISIASGSVVINWSPVPHATTYKVYSSAITDAGFSIDNSGTFSGNSWTAPLTGDQRFYYVVYESDAVPGEFVYVPGGTFQMGNTKEGLYPNELPVHSVTLNSFYIGKYEVTQAEFSQYMQPQNSWTERDGLGDNYPAYYVAWFATIKYCNLRSMAEGLTPVYKILGTTNPAFWGDVPNTSGNEWHNVTCNWNANGYRLPTEAEWEYAARGGTNTPDYRYSGSDDCGAVAWYTLNNTPRGCKPVGTKAPNGLGIYDMSGNVHEHCWDAWWEGYYAESPSDNPVGPLHLSHYSCVNRGGHWNGSDGYCQVFRRRYENTHTYSPYIGFRLCRSGL